MTALTGSFMHFTTHLFCVQLRCVVCVHVDMLLGAAWKESSICSVCTERVSTYHTHSTGEKVHGGL